MADFGGWLMPIEYPGAGVIAEHTAVRERVGLFDVSHLGKASITGEGALEFLNSAVTNDLDRIGDGSAQYNLLCDDNGGVIDDLIVYRNSPADLFLIPNAANTADVVATLTSRAPSGLTITNLHESFAVLALQGPKSGAVLESLGIKSDIDYMAFEKVTIAGHSALLCRTGYTGEYGYEIVPAWSDASAVWDALVNAMAPFDGLVCGLGARDTLRTEMGYPLHGHELSLDISPVQASASWAVAWDKPSFFGHEVLRAEKAAGPKLRMRALKSLDRGIPRAEMEVKDATGAVVGKCTSGTFSPTLRVGIGLALLVPSVKVGDKVTIDIRGRVSEAEVVTSPFVPSHVR